MSIRDGQDSNRVREMRMQVSCDSCGEPLVVTKAQLNWSSEFTCVCGHVHDLAWVVEQLEHQGWNVHDLIRGRGSFREPVANLPMPHGGAFAVGRSGIRADSPDRGRPRRWQFKKVDEARPSEKGFTLVE
jgi:hypothetical protein